MPKSLTAADRSSLIKLASSLEKGSEERKAILAGLAKVSYLGAWAERIGLKGRYGVLQVLNTGEDWISYISPGPMGQGGNFSYVLELRDDVLHLPTEEEISSYQRGHQRDLSEIERGQVAWWEPAEGQYNFGISVEGDGTGRVDFRFFGKPTNARGWGLDLGYSRLYEEDASRELQKYSSESAIRKHLASFEGKRPKWNKA
jgi:hypothetical protein